MEMSTDLRKLKCFTLKQSFTPSPFGVKADGIKKEAIPPLFTNTVMVSVAMQLVVRSVAVTRYNVVAEGDASGLAMELLFKAPAGDHKNCADPVADNCALAILQSISFDFDALIIGTGSTVTVVLNVAELLQAISFIATV